MKVQQYQRIQCPDCGKTIKVTVGFTVPKHRMPLTKNKIVCPASGRRLNLLPPSAVNQKGDV